jgi:hypothetical protein
MAAQTQARRDMTMASMGIISTIKPGKIAKFAISIYLSNKNCIKSKSAAEICQDSNSVEEDYFAQI